MLNRFFQLDRVRVRRVSAASAAAVARLGGLTLLLAGLPGCQNIAGGMPVSQVRVINASPDAPGLDIYQGEAASGLRSGAGQSGAALAYNLGFGTVTSYVTIGPGSSTIAADTAGSRQQMTVSKATFAASGEYTVLIGNVAGDLTQTILTDQNVAAPAGQISVRLLDQVTRFNGGVDVYLVPAGSTVGAASPILTDAVFGTNSGYINVPAGTYTLVLLPAGAVPGTTTPLYTGAKVTYAAGSARTLILLDRREAGEAGFQAITADDFDPPAGTN